MKRILMIAALAPLVTLHASERTEKTEKVFQLSAAGRRLQIDNIFGSVEVTGGTGSEIRASIVKTIRYDSDEMLARAQRDVRLEMTQDGNAVRLHVAYPNDNCPCGNGNHNWRGDQDYRVRYDFRVETPPGTELKLGTVDGEMSVRNTSGDFDVNNVNGGIEMADIAGSGSAHTVNGKVKASFAKNPAGNASFKSINGEIAITFQPGLSADVRLKTMNGEAWTDFDTTALPSEVAATEHSGARFVFRRDRSTSVRIGSGGPSITLDTLNGNIYVLKRGNKS